MRCGELWWADLACRAALHAACGGRCHQRRAVQPVTARDLTFVVLTTNRSLAAPPGNVVVPADLT